jgi:hypothetical protein
METRICIHCRRVGFVRLERVIKAGDSTTLFYCGACERSWSVREEDAERKAPGKPRKRD